MNVHPFIAFEGPIASGKTTHARILAERLGAQLLLEDFPQNEFLEDFYGDHNRWAFQMQLSFVVLRRQQLRTINAPLVRPVVMDYSHLKNSMFAHVLLEDRELRLYQQVSEACQEHIVEPDLVVYLDARDDVLLDRIRTRNRPYEAKIDAAYQKRIRDGYEIAFGARPGLTVVRWDTSDLDLSSRGDIDSLHDNILFSLNGSRLR